MKNLLDTFAKGSLLIAALALVSCNNPSGKSGTEDTGTPAEKSTTQPYQISLAQWSFNDTFFGEPISDWGDFGKTLREDPDAVIRGTDPMEFPAMAAELGIGAIELVNTFYFGKAGDEEYWKAFRQKCDEEGVKVLLIMCDQLGDLGNADPEARKQTVENHYPWVDAAAMLGAHSIRVNAGGQGTAEEVAENAADGLSMLAEYGAEKGINIIVENHGGYSSDGSWLAGLMEKVNKENVGTLPDFGNFCIERGPDGCVNEYDRYKGVRELMPYAEGVSAKSHEFDEEGNETSTDFLRMMQIVKESGFTGYVGIEYEGKQLSEKEGILATKALLERVFDQL